MCFGIPDSLHLESAETYISNIYQPKKLLNMSSAKHINIYTQRHEVVINESMSFQVGFSQRALTKFRTGQDAAKLVLKKSVSLPSGGQFRV